MPLETEILAFQYALNPNKTQTTALFQHVGAVRFAYNWAVGTVLENWAEAKNNPETEYLKTSAYDLRKLLNSVKSEVAPWQLAEKISKEAFATGTANAATAFKNFHAKRGGVPKFHKKSRTKTPAIIFSTGTRRITKTHVILPNLGEIRLHETPRKLLWLMSQGAETGKFSVRFTKNRWFVTVNLRVPFNLARQFHLARTKTNRKPVVGLDFGVKTLITSSDGLVVENPRAYEKSLLKLKKLQRRLSRQQKQSKRRERTRTQIAKQSARVQNIEKDATNKATKFFVDNYDVIAIEDLNVRGMVRNRALSRRIQHSLFGEMRRQLDYKSRRYENDLVVADRFFPSSKTCSGCGKVKTKLSLAQRIYDCNFCGLSLGRDLNAAINLKNVAWSYRETLNGRGEEGSDSDENLSETDHCEASSVLVA